MRPTKPTKIKKAQGTLRKCRENPDEPEPETGVSTPPSWLDEPAREEWKRAGAVLERMGLISEMDLVAFAGYCTAVSDLIRCEEIIRREGVMTTITLTRGGGERDVTHPAADLKHKVLGTIRRFMTEFGMSPASRPRVHAEPKESEAAKTARKYLIN